MFFISVFYYVNNDVFHKTDFVNTKVEIDELCQSYYKTYLDNCKLKFDDTLLAYRLHDKMTYRDNHMFSLDYGQITTLEPDTMEEGYESDTEYQIKKLK